MASATWGRTRSVNALPSPARARATRSASSTPPVPTPERGNWLTGGSRERVARTRVRWAVYGTVSEEQGEDAMRVRTLLMAAGLVAVAGLGSLVPATAVGAGGWAVTTLDPVSAVPVPGRSTPIGYTIR